jgi:curved DNA-binding protein
LSIKFQDYYAVLGVARDATREDIQRAYRKLARKSHPDVDKTAGASDRFKHITEAYEVLKDPKKRERYDQLGENWKDGQEFTPPPGWEGFSFGGRSARNAGARPGQGGATEFTFGEGGDFSSFFEAMFGGGDPRTFRSRAARPRAGRDIESSIVIPLEDAYAGATRTLSFAADESGEGARTYDVKIPAGTTHGSTIRLKGQGEPGANHGPPGDLLLHVEIAPHARFTVSGHDLGLVLPIAPWEAVLGARVAIRTLDGGEVLLTVPAGSSSGKKLRMRNMGLPVRHGQRGDLLVELGIAVPNAPDEAEKKLYEDLKKASKFDPRAS